MARPKEPIDLVIAKGKKHLTKSEIEQRKIIELKVPCGNPEPPEYLPSNLRNQFICICNKLVNIGIMTELDIDCLASYLIARQSYLQLTSRFTKSLKTSDIKNTDVILKMQDKLYKQMMTSASALGLTISSRCKLVLPKQEETPKQSKWAKYGG